MAAKSVALISGIGGSGKTVLGICMAKMLADCGQRVLLIDCDFSTNGATFFFEDQLCMVNNTKLSFMGLLEYVTQDNVCILEMNQSSENCIIDALFCVNNNLAFIPSVLPCNSKTKLLGHSYESGGQERFKNLCFKHFSYYFDFIIFDCQPGYSEALELVLPVSDSVLFVIEANAISAASMRNLYSKIYPLLASKRVYQVFNKVSYEEKEIYEKITNGTFFENIGSVVYDWEIHKAIALAIIPDLKMTKSDFGMQVYSVCNRVFDLEHPPGILRKYSLILEHNQLRENMEKYESHKQTGVELRRILSTILLAFVTIIISVFGIIRPDIVSLLLETAHIIMIPVFTAFIILGLYVLFNSIDYRKSKERKEYLINKRKLEDLLESNPDLNDYLAKE